MSDWLSFEESVARVRLRMGLIVATAPQELLIPALRAGLVETHQGPSDPIAQVTNSWIVSVSSLNAWIDGLLGIGPKVVRAPPPSQQQEVALSAQQAAAARAVEELWGGKVPAGLTVDRRDEEIREFARKHKIAVPSERTIRRYFVARLGRS